MSRSLYARLNQRYGHPIDVFTRREMLKATLAASAGLLLSRGLPAFAQDKPRAAGKRVVVIGGGFSGLSCAHELLAAGYDVTVVEARNRIGGRVISFSDLVKGKNVEGGGELIGSNHPTWVSYAEKFGLKFIDITEDPERIVSEFRTRFVDTKVFLDKPAAPAATRSCPECLEAIPAAARKCRACASPVV